jgi:hypothetical protein
MSLARLSRTHSSSFGHSDTEQPSRILARLEKREVKTEEEMSSLYSSTSARYITIQMFYDGTYKIVFRIRIFLGLSDPIATSADPAPDTSIIKQK